jgi:hypothetical protein
MILTMAENLSSEKVDPQLIQSLISKTVKHTNHRYRCVAANRQRDQWGARQEKVWNRLRSEWSIERFKAARQEFWGSNLFQQREFIEKMEIFFDGR